MKNHTLVLEFIILGLSNNHHVNIILFVVLSDVFLLSLIGNIIIATISLMDHRLQTPMYFFLRNFALLEICFTSVIMPRLLDSLLTERKSISLPGCFLQLLLVFFLGASMFCHGATMSFDRYIAICHPLHYGTIMNGRICFQLVLSCWVVSLLVMVPPAFMVVLLPFCGPNIINHFYCDTAALLQLSCMDTGHLEMMIFVSATVILLGTFTVTAISYGCIIFTIMRIPSITGRKKAFSTCSAHLLVVVILYSSSIFRYIRPAQRGVSDLDKVVSFLYCVVVPLCIIFTIMRIPSITGRKKAFSTCSAHLLVVVILYSSSIFRYIRPAQHGVSDHDKVVSFLYCVVVPLFNPYIYALRNEQMKESLKDACHRAFSKCLRLS